MPYTTQNNPVVKGELFFPVCLYSCLNGFIVAVIFYLFILFGFVFLNLPRYGTEKMSAITIQKVPRGP